MHIKSGDSYVLLAPPQSVAGEAEWRLACPCSRLGAGGAQ